MINFLEGANSTHGLGSFGYCYMQPSCKGILYPEEVEAALEQLPEEEIKAIGGYKEILEKYKKYFYEKFETATKGGGGEESGPLTPLENGVCVLPPRRPKHSTSRSKTRKSKYKKSSNSRSKSKTRKSN